MEKQNSFVYRIFQNVIHYSKCLIIWFVCTKIVGLWMISLNDKPNVSVISDSDLIVSYANLSKYQDTACFGDNLSFRVRLKYRIKFCLFELIRIIYTKLTIFYAFLLILTLGLCL